MCKDKALPVIIPRNSPTQPWLETAVNMTQWFAQLTATFGSSCGHIQPPCTLTTSGKY
jgi:hypothetical protein